MKQLLKFLPFLFLWIMSSCINIHLPGTTTTSAPGRSSINKSSLETLGIPKGHLPPPGECKIWYPDRPAGQQPSPHKCSSGSVPAGAWLVERLNSKEVRVHFYEGGIKDVRTYRAE